MSADRDVTRIVRSWLREDAHEDADRVLDLVLDQIDATPQRRATWPAWRFPLVKNTLRIAVAAALLVAAAVFGIQFLSGSNTGGPGPSLTPTSEPTATPATSSTPAAADFPPPGVVTIGRHSMTLAGARLSLEFATAGWTSNGEWGMEKGNFRSGAADSAGFIFWPASAPDNVFGDPCTETPLSPPAGPSAAELAAAVSKVPGTNLVSGPSEVSVGGYPAQHVVLTVPEGVGCAAEEFYLWEDKDNPGSARYATQLGSTIYVWIIEVDGKLVWIDGETYVSSSPQAAQEVQQIVDSIRFE